MAERLFSRCDCSPTSTFTPVQTLGAPPARSHFCHPEPCTLPKLISIGILVLAYQDLTCLTPQATLKGSVPTAAAFLALKGSVLTSLEFLLFCFLTTSIFSCLPCLTEAYECLETEACHIPPRVYEQSCVGSQHSALVACLPSTGHVT